MIKTLTLLSLALTVVSGQDVVAGFKAEGVVDDVLIEAPPALLEVKYVEQDVKAELGNTLAVSKAGSQPEVIFAGAESGQQYTLAMVDPDAPSRKENVQYLHWLIVNIPGSDLLVGDLSLGKVLMAHNGPSPPQGSGPHRYVFLLYSQGRNPVRARVSRNRAGFSIKKWTSGRNDLGNPVAGNFYVAENP